MDTFTCGQCGRQFENKNLLKQFRVVKLGKDFCSSGCEKAYERDHSDGPKSSSSDSFSKGANAQPIIVKKGPSADEIRAEAEVERMERDENASQPWKFAENFDDKASINSISFPRNVEDIEKTVEKIIKAGVEKIKSVVEDHEMGVGAVQVGDKSFLKPYHEEFAFVEACFEKAQEGIKKLKRIDESEHPKIRAIINDIEDAFSDFKEKWFPKLVEKREKKKKKNLIVVGVMLLLVVAFFTWAALR